ncbi:Maestro heat-like repeat-containing protein family member 2A [Dirofilaria immitis]
MKLALLFVSFLQQSYGSTRRYWRTWRDEHPQYRQLFSTSRILCYSCMSPYLEHQYMYISHLYRRPMSFTPKCDQSSFDSRFLNWKNCSDLCVILKMNDRLGGRRREGYLRGCMSDIIHYNQTLTALGVTNACTFVKLHDLFISTERYLFENSDQVQLCACHKDLCNTAPSKIPIYHLILMMYFLHIFS